MAYRFKNGESVADGVHRIAREELEGAVGLLSKAGNTAQRDKAIHETRKSLKKTRALLRLVRPALDGQFGRENRRLRDLGRKLSAHRDSKVMLEVFDALRQKYREEMGRRTLGSIRRALLAEKRQSERGVAQAIERGAAALRTVAAQVEKWPLAGHGFSLLEPGLTATYRSARKELTGDAHEWRKRVKDHWYHVRLLEDFWTDLMVGQEKSLKDLETWLGDHHNLQVLAERLQADPARYGAPEDIALAKKLIRRYQKELYRNAQSLGERLLEEKPRSFATRMQHLWDSWRTQPKQLGAIEKEKRQAAG
jgi:CHAD domain-containing protein